MRIGFGLTALSRGQTRNHIDGIGVYTQQLWKALNACGRDLYGLRWSDCQHELDISGDHTCIERSFKLQIALSAVTKLPFSGLGFYEKNINIFHATDHYIPKFRHIPVVATVMDTIPFSHPQWVSAQQRRLKNFVFRHSARWAKRIITISESSKLDIVQHFNIDESQIDVIPLGVNTAFFSRVADDEIARILRKYGARQGSFIFVGTLQPRKNIRRLIQAYQTLPSDIQNAHPLLVIGKYGWGDDALRDDLYALQKRKQGLWLNAVSVTDLYALLQSATALVYPSLYEGFGLPILEGFASGLPVISSNTTSIPEVAGDAALLVDPMSIDAIATAMQRLLEDRELAATLSVRGQERALSFTWARTAEQTLDVYRRVLAEG